MVASFKGRKTSSSSTSTTLRPDDNLFSTDTVELLLAVSEGPILGFADGAASFFVGDVPLLDKGTQTPNISNFELRLLKGTNPADSIRLHLGGQSSTRNVGLELRTLNQIIVAQGNKTQIDFIDFRFNIQRLLNVDKAGNEYQTSLLFKIEVKPRSSNVWQIPFTSEKPPDADTSGASNYRPGTDQPGTLVNDAYRETYLQPSTQPPSNASAVGAMWFITDITPWSPRIWDGATWQVPNNLAGTNQLGFAVWNWIDYDGGARSAWFSPSGAAPPPGTLKGGDFLLTPQSGEEVYSYNETAWVGFQNWGKPATQQPGVVAVTGISRSSYPKEYRIPVTRINEPYDVRVTRLTEASDKFTYRDITFESIQEVNGDVVSFPDLAVTWLTIKATDTFTSIPDFTSVMRGLVIPVPSNYNFNFETKLGEYTGIWDGTFKFSYTNSPAWHAYNFIMNARYGKNSYYPEVADKWDYYNFGVHCDLHGFRFNEYIQEARSLNELINYTVGIAGGRYIDRGDGYSSVLWDADDQPAVALFSPENTAEGSFKYSFTDVTERKNDFKVSFKNPELNYREDRLRVYDQNSIDVYGRNAEEFVAVGCRDAVEAVKRGRLRLATSLTENIIVNFSTNRLGRYLTPFQIILVADDQSTNVISGRILAPDGMPTGSTVLPLRDQIYLEAGISYSVTFTLSNGAGGTKLVTYPLSVPVPGQQTVLRLTQALSEPIPEFAVFSIGSPKAFRITSISEADDDKDNIDITAIEVNRQKWAFVDGLVELRDILAVQTGPLSKFVYPVSNARIIPEVTADGHYNLVVAWNASETRLIRGYRLYQSLNNGPMTRVAETSDTQFTIADVTSGTYLVSIVAVGLDGTTESPPVTVQYIVSNSSSLRSVTPPTNLRLVNEPEAPIFRQVDARFAWDAAADPLVVRYLVEVVSPSNNVVHSETVEGRLDFTYTLIANRADNGGNPVRQFTLRVSSVDTTGNRSAPIALVVSHPAPPIIAFQLDAVSETVFVQLTAPPVPDWLGSLIWMETVDGFNPLTTSPRADGPGTFFPLPAKVDTNYYVRVAGYDNYGRTGLNISDQKRIFTSNKLFDPNGPLQPTGLVLTTASETLADGTLSASVTAAWDAPQAADAAYGNPEVEIAEGTGSNLVWVGSTVPASQRTWTRSGLKPGVVYSVRLRFKHGPKALLDGPYTPVQTIRAALNLVPPANPTNLRIQATNETVFLTFTPSATRDLKWVEVWGFNGISTDATPPAAATLLGQVDPLSSQFIDRVSTGAGRTYWLRSVNTSDVPAAAYLRSESIIAPAIQAAQIAAGIIDATKLASSLAAPTVISGSTPPTVKTSQYITLDGDASGKLYRWDTTAGKYTTAVAAIDVGPGLTAAQITSVNAAALQGQVSDAQIQALSATKVSGQLSDAQLQALSANKLVGQVVASQVASVNATALQGLVTSAQIQNLDAAKLAGQITSTQITDNSISTAKLQAASVLAGNIAAGSILASKLAVASSNLAVNTKLMQGARGWIALTNEFAGAPGLNIGISDGYCPNGFKGYSVSPKAALPTGQPIFVVHQTVNAAGVQGTFPITSGTTYEWSVAVASGMPVTQASIKWLTSAGVFISQSYGPNAGYGGGLNGDVRYFPRAYVIAQAPANAAFAELQVIGYNSTTASSGGMTVSAAMFAACITGQTEPSPYQSEGLTVIDGSTLITGSVAADRITANSITTAQIQAGGIAADRLVANSITAGQLAANAVTAGKIDANAITARELTVGSVLASKIAISSTNRFFNSDGSQGTRGFFPYHYITNGPGFTVATDLNYAPNGFTRVIGSFVGTIAKGNRVFQKIFPIDTAGNPAAFKISGNETFEFSFASASNFASVQANIIWYDASGNYINESSGAVTGGGGLGGELRSYSRAWVIGQAPANAVTCEPRAIFYDTNNDVVNGNFGITAVMFTACRPGQTEPSPYSPPGLTVMDGASIVTGSIQASKIVANSITAGQIASGTITATQIAAQTITGNEIKANSVGADRIVANSITAAQIQAGAISTTQLAAEAITAAKLGIGLNSGNMIWNSDQAISGWFASSGASYTIFSNNTDWRVDGTTSSIMMNRPGSDPDGYDVIELQYPQVDGSRTLALPIQAGKQYEYSVYMSVHRCQGYLEWGFFDGNGTYFGQTGGGYSGDNGAPNGKPTDAWRSRVMITAPDNAKSIRLRVVMHAIGGNNGYVFASGFYFGVVPNGATKFSEYAPQSRTVITGGAIATNSISANRIVANSITTDQIAASGINADRIEVTSLKARMIATGALTADTITVGNGTLSSLFSGSNSTQINGGAISANSIRANRLQIGNRGISILGLNMRFNAATRQIQWDSGAIAYIDSNGNQQSQGIVADAFTVNGSSTYVILWTPGRNYFDRVADDWGFANRQPESWVEIATYANSYSGLAVNYGATVIDGDQIITGSIKANRIAANEIQSYHMAANSISGDRIVAGSLIADKIASGTIQADTIFLRDDRFWFDGPNQLLRIRNRYNGAEQVSIGAVGKFYSNNNDFGIILRNGDGVEIFKVAGGYARMAGAIIDDASITNAKIGNLEVDSAKIRDLTVGNTKIADLAATQVVASGTSGTDTGNQGIYIRGSGKVVVFAFFNGASTRAIPGGPGDLLIYRDGNIIAQVSSSFWTVSGNGSVSYFLNAMSIVAIDTPGGGSHSYRAFTSNGSGIGGVTLVVIECSK